MHRPLVDEGYLDRLRTALGPDTLSEILSDGMIELADRLARLDALARAGQQDAVASLCHDIVAVAGHMGLGALSAAAARLNTQIRATGCGGRGVRQAIGSGDTAAAEIPAAMLSEMVAQVIALGEPSLHALSERTGIAVNG